MGFLDNEGRKKKINNLEDIAKEAIQNKERKRIF